MGIELITICVLRDDKMSVKKLERVHLTIAPPSKKGNNNHKNFKPHKRNNQSNTYNPSNF